MGGAGRIWQVYFHRQFGEEWTEVKLQLFVSRRNNKRLLAGFMSKMTETHDLTAIEHFKVQARSASAAHIDINGAITGSHFQ